MKNGKEDKTTWHHSMWIIDTKNKKSEEKKSKSKHIKLLIVGGIVFILSRILHGQLL